MWIDLTVNTAATATLMSSSKPPKILISVGNSGGHIYPGVAVAEELSRLEVEVDFLASLSPINQNILQSTKFPCTFMPLGQLAGNSLLKRAKTLTQALGALARAVKHIRRQSYSAVLSTGGAMGGVGALAARVCGARVFIFEPNAVPGLANMWSKGLAEKIFVVFKDSFKSGACECVGFPLRQSFRAQLFTPPQKGATFKILVLGGSQGAHEINQAVQELLLSHHPVLAQTQWLHQTGAQHIVQIKQSYKNLPFVTAKDFLQNMPQAIANAHLVISRCGMGALSELAACGRPVLLVPLKGHQHENAKRIAHSKGGVLCTPGEFCADFLASTLKALKSAPHNLQAQAQNMAKLHTGGAARKIAQIMKQSLYE